MAPETRSPRFVRRADVSGLCHNPGHGLSHIVKERRLNARSEVLLGAAVVAAEVPRSLASGLVPLIVGALIDDRGFSGESASLLASTELLAGAISALLSAGWIGRVSRVRVAGVGLALALSAQLLSIIEMPWPALAALRIVLGAGAGMAAAAGVAAAASSRNPERLFAATGLAAALAAAILVIPIGHSVERFGADGVFGACFLIALVLAPFIRHLPTPPPTTRAGQLLPARREGILLMVSLFAFAIGQTAIWAFTERIGKELGMSVSGVSGVLAATGLAGIVGAGAAALLGTRWGRTFPLSLAIIISVVSVLGLTEGRTEAIYISANAGWAFGYAFAIPYFLGACAAIDIAGRWTAAGLGASAVGGALGPAVAGMLVETGDYTALTGLMILTGFTALITSGLVVWKLDRTGA